MKKLLLIILALFIPGLSSLAAEDGIRSITVDVFLNPDGSANITEVWDINNVHDGTEYYIGMPLLDSMNVHSLTVSDESGREFTPTFNWDINASFEEKAFRSGIISTNDGYELAWGISQFGDRVFTISYVIDGLVQGFEDGPGIPGHVFISSDLSSTPGRVLVTIHGPVPFTTENTYFETWGRGDAILDNGTIAFASSSPNFVTVRSQFAPETFSPGVQNDLYFDDFHIVPEPISFWVIFIPMASIVIAILGFIGFFHGRYKLTDGSIRRKPRDLMLTHHIPLNGSIPAISKIMGNSAALGAYLLKWHGEGIIEGDDDKITFTYKEAQLEEIEARLLGHLQNKANKNGVLSAKKLAKWVSNDKMYQFWQQNLVKAGEKELLDLGILGVAPNGKIRYTPYGFEQLLEFWGYEKYIKEFDGGNQLQEGDFIMAILLGLDDRMKDFTQRYPDSFTDDTLIFYQMMWWNHTFNHSVHRHSQSYSDSSGGSGANFGGGGGFSGGGGGGSR
ncbi:MAG: DUF2207 domain-containing protein [Turicibacter sp.]|nr:DUF2207 domain-containing protein [Turicibacter sp.]